MLCKWLPDFYPAPDWNNFSKYELELYVLFRQVYLETPLKFKDIVVRYRHQPLEDGKENVFYHLTCKDYEANGNRSPDPERITRIKWPRAFIENYDCSEGCCLVEEGRLLYWIQPEGTKLKHKIYYRDFLVVLEERQEYYLLVTGFYVEEIYYRKGLVKQWSKWKAKSAT